MDPVPLQGNIDPLEETGFEAVLGQIITPVMLDGQTA
jgi:hypothetical protein